MENKKIYTLEINGVKESFDAIVKLNEVLNVMDEAINKTSENKELNDAVSKLNENLNTLSQTINTTSEEEQKSTSTKKEAKTQTDELAKVQQKLTEYDAEYQKQLLEAKQALAEKNKALKDEVAQEKLVEGSYYAKQAVLTALGKQIKNYVATTDDEKQTLQELKTQYASLNEELKEFDKDMGNHQREVGNYEIATKKLTTQIREMQDELANMLANGVSPTDAAYIELAQRAGALQDAMGDARAEINRFADDSKRIKDVVDIATTATSVFGLYQSTMTAFGVENEAVAESIEKLMAVQTALNSLEQLSTQLKDNSTMSYKLLHKALQAVGLEKKKTAVATTQDTTATVANTTATVASTAATSASTVALKAFKIALASTGIGLIVIALGYLIANFSEIKNKVVEFLPFLGELGNAFDKFKSICMGVGQAIIDYITTPVKTIIAVVKGFMQDGIKGAIKAGTAEFKKGINVIDNYKKGYDKQEEKNRESREKANAKSLDKQLDYQIKTLEAQQGSNYKFTQEGRKVYEQFYANKLKMYDKDSDEYKAALLDQMKFTREVTEHDKAEEEKRTQKAQQEQDKRNQAAKAAADKRKSDLEKLKNDTNKILEDTTKLFNDNEQSRLDFSKKKIQELKVYNQEQLDYKLSQLQDIDKKQNDLIKKQYDKEIEDVKEQYDKLIKEAERLGQNTEQLTKDKQDRLNQLEEKFNQEQLERQQELSKSILTEQNNLNNQLIENSKRNIDEISKTLDNQLKNIKTMNTKTTKTGGFFNVIDVDKTKADIDLAIGEYQKLSSSITEQKQIVSDELDMQLQLTSQMYGQDSKQYQDLLNQKTTALAKYDSDLKVSLQATKDLQTQEANLMKEYWDSVAKEIGDKFQMLNEVILTPLYDAFSALNDMALEDAQKNLEKVTKLHDKAVEQVTDSQNKIQSLNDEINNANGLRRDELQKVLDDEVRMLAQREIEEQRLAQQKQKAEDEVAKKEKAQKKMDAAKQIIQGLINTAIAVTAALPNIPLAAIVGAMGAASVAIATAQYSKLEEGGFIESGKLHKDGGIKIPGTNIEIEKGEFVINRKATQKYLPVLEAINNSTKPNKSSNITYNNVYKQFADGGQLDYQLMSELAANSIPTTKFNQPYEDNRPVVVSVVDINKGQGRVARVKDIAGGN